MTFPLLIVAPLFGFPCQQAQNKVDEENNINCCAVFIGGIATAIFDLAATVTLLIVGILGTLRVIGMSPAAAFACIGAGCLIPLLWVMELYVCCATPTDPQEKEEEIK